MFRTSTLLPEYIGKEVMVAKFEWTCPCLALKNGMSLYHENYSVSIMQSTGMIILKLKGVIVAVNERALEIFNGLILDGAEWRIGHTGRYREKEDPEKKAIQGMARMEKLYDKVLYILSRPILEDREEWESALKTLGFIIAPIPGEWMEHDPSEKVPDFVYI
jgi:hypothetical protein